MKDEFQCERDLGLTKVWALEFLGCEVFKLSIDYRVSRG